MSRTKVIDHWWSESKPWSSYAQLSSLRCYALFPVFGLAPKVFDYQKNIFFFYRPISITNGLVTIEIVFPQSFSPIGAKKWKSRFFYKYKCPIRFWRFCTAPTKNFLFHGSHFLDGIKTIKRTELFYKKKIFFRKSHKTAKIELGQPSQTRFWPFYTAPPNIFSIMPYFGQNRVCDGWPNSEYGPIEKIFFFSTTILFS